MRRCSGFENLAGRVALLFGMCFSDAHVLLWLDVFVLAAIDVGRERACVESGLSQLLSTTRAIHPFVLRRRATVPPSARWNGFLSRAFFSAGTRFRRANQKNCLQLSMFWNIGGYVDSRSILRPARRHGMTSWETTRRMQGEER